MMVATKVLALGPWGRLVDRHGPVVVYRISAFLVALVPIPWMFADRASIVYAAQALSGLAWAGNEVSLLALTLAAAGTQRRTVVVVAQSMANGLAQVSGGLVGSALTTAFPPGHQLVFGISAVGRAMVGLLAPVLLAPLARSRGSTSLAARVVAWLPNGGLVRQLVIGDARRRPTTDAATDERRPAA
jgi:MFS family permease